MTVETPIEGIWSLDETQPQTTDSRREGDDHLRLIKDAIRKTFASVNDVIDCTDEELNILSGALITTAELNYLDGVTGNIQTQIDDPTIMHTDENNTTVGWFKVSNNFVYINRDVQNGGRVFLILQNTADVAKASLYVYDSSDVTRPDAFAVLNSGSVPKLIIRQDALNLELTSTSALLGGNALALQSAVTALDTATAKNTDFTRGTTSVFPDANAYTGDTGFGTNDFEWGISGVNYDGAIITAYTTSRGYVNYHAGDTDGVVISRTPNISGISAGQIRFAINGPAGSQNVYWWARKNI